MQELSSRAANGLYRVCWWALQKMSFGRAGSRRPLAPAFRVLPKEAQPISSAEVLSHFGEEVGTSSGSDRITVPAISIFVVSCDSVVTAPGTDPRTVVPQLRHHPKVY